MATDEELSPSADDPRVRWAAERTLLAWIRTGLALMGFGFVVARFGIFLRELETERVSAAAPHSSGWSVWIGTSLIALGVAIHLVTAVGHYRDMQRLGRREPLEPRNWSLAVVVSLVLAAIGTLTAAYLVISSRA